MRKLFILSLTVLVWVSCTPKAAQVSPPSAVSESSIPAKTDPSDPAGNTDERTGPPIDFTPFVSSSFHSKSGHALLGVVDEGQDIYFSLKENDVSIKMDIFTDRPILHADLPKSRFTFHTEDESSVLSYNDRQIEFYLSSSGSMDVYLGASHKYENPWDDIVFNNRIDYREVPTGSPIIQNDHYQTSAVLKVIAQELPSEEDMRYGDIPDYFHRLPLDYAIRSSQRKLYSPILISDAAKLNRPQSDQSLLQTCIDNRDYEGLKFLLSNGYDPYASNPTGSEINKYPLISALNDVKALSIFLDHVDLEKKFQSYRKWYQELTFQTENDEDGTIVTTLLGFAVLAGKGDATKMLIAQGARTDAKIEFQPFGERPKNMMVIREKLK